MFILPVFHVGQGLQLFRDLQKVPKHPETSGW
jgi:hypothetical protein